MSRPKPKGGGRPTQATSFVRPLTAPRAALVFEVADITPYADWPRLSGTGAADAQLSHVGGWNCEMAGDKIHLVNPLGEGVLTAPAPDVSDHWLQAAQATESTAIHLVPSSQPGTDGDPERIVTRAALDDPIPAGTVRTSFDTTAPAGPEKVGRNDPCPCGSGRKHKQCCGRS